MSRKHHRTINPVRAHRQRQADKKRQARIGLALGITNDIVVAVSVFTATKVLVEKIRDAKARKAGSNWAPNPADAEKIVNAHKALSIAQYDRAGTPRFSVARIKARKAVKLAAIALDAEYRLVDAKHVAYGAQARGVDASMATDDAMTNRLARKVRREEKRQAKSQADASQAPADISAVA